MSDKSLLDKLGGLSGGGMAGALGSFFGGPWGTILGGIGSIFGGQKSLKEFDKGRSDILNLPGMDGPSQLGGMFGQYSGNNFLGNAGTAAAQDTLFGLTPQLLQGIGSADLTNALGQLQMGPAASSLNSVLQQQLGAMNEGSLAAAPGLFNQGFANLAAAGDSSALQQQQYDALMARAQPGRDRALNAMTTKLGNMGLLGPNTDVESSNALSRTLANEFGQQDLDFQREAFNQGLARQQFLGNLGMNQIGQGLGAEAQAFGQTAGALSQNQQSAMNRFTAATNLFGLDQDTYAKQYGMGIQGIEAQNIMNQFGLMAGRAPYELQAQLLSGGGQHADALWQLANAKANASSSFFGGLFG